MPLNTEPNLVAPDDFYERLIELHRGLSEEASAQLNTRLVLLLANHIGDAGVLAEAMQAARAGLTADPPPALPTGDGGPSGNR
jgi:hypothetical protein